MKTVEDFATACKHLTATEIYNLFENDISDELRDAIYSWSEGHSPEPAREAFNEIGRHYSVQTLAQY